MSILDMFKGKQYREENEQLRKELATAQSLMTPEMHEIQRIMARIAELSAQAGTIEAQISTAEKKLADTNKDIETQINNANLTLSNINAQIETQRGQLLDVNDKLLFQEFSLYEPKYDLIHSEDYKKKLDHIRAVQKALIKNGNAITGSPNWMVNNSAVEGRKMVADMQKLLLRAFNSECDELISRVTYSNVELYEKRITKSCEAISKLGKIMSIGISYAYQDAKVQELHLVFEYQQAKQREKEEQKEIRAQMREEAKLQKALEEERKKVEKEQKHYQNALAAVLKQLECASEDQKAALEEKRKELEEQLGEIDKNLKDIDYREANAKAGYVYIISNIGSFGENIYKIGMTRRLDPMDRIDELGDASVPFNFDVHAMIFSDNAPALEAALHKAFEHKKLNMVNHRREFFAVTLDEIKEVVKNNFSKSVEFIEFAPAQQYRESLKMKEKFSET